MDKNKKTFQVPTLLAFAAIVAIMVIVGVRVLNVPVVPMCLLVIIEAVIAVMLHHAELWVHGLLILAELCAGVAGKKTVLIILCASPDYQRGTAAWRKSGGRTDYGWKRTAYRCVCRFRCREKYPAWHVCKKYEGRHQCNRTDR